MDFLQDQDILWVLEVLIKAFDMIGDHSLVLEPIREMKIKILKTVFKRCSLLNCWTFNKDYVRSDSSEVVSEDRGCTKKSAQTFYFISQKWLMLESKVKLEVKTMGQEL